MKTKLTNKYRMSCFLFPNSWFPGE
jgi:hypothetical protein